MSMGPQQIFLSTPNLCGNEEKYLQECVRTNFVSTAGAFVTRFEQEMAKRLGAKHAVAVVNGTAGLHLSLHILGVGAGDEVLCPNLTFVAPLNSVLYTGATPVLIDSEWATLGMCPQNLKDFLQEFAEMKNGVCYNKKSGKRIAALMPMHTLGHACDLGPLLALAQQYKIKVVEDASESVGVKYRGRCTGTWAEMGVLSFNGNKTITCGGGGVILTDNEALAKKAKHLSTTAKTDTIRFVHDEMGFNYRMVNILAALGVAQLEKLDEFLAIKKNNANFYEEKIKKIPGLRFYRAQNREHSLDWLHTLVVEKDYPLSRDQLLDAFIKEKVEVRPIWTLMEDLPMFKQAQKSSTTVSRQISQQVLNIPSSTHLKTSEMERVVSLLAQWGQGKK